MIFTYNIKITGPIANIRKFMNSMLEAYKDNRIYVIKSVVLTSKEDVKSIVNSETKAAAITAKGRNRYHMEPEKEEIVEEPSQSGVPIIGINKTVTADIKFQYIIYIGDELTEN
jgi:hypothetical protein